MLLLAGCAARPLQTLPARPAESCPSGRGRVVGLLGFDGDARLRPLADDLARLLETDGFAVERRSLRDAHGLDLAVALEDYHPDIVSGATARRHTNIYFLSTVVAAWMIPVMGAFDHSTVGLQADISITDTRAGRVLWRGTAAASNDEPPSGMPGEDDGHYTQVRLERIDSDLAVHVRDRLCASLSGV